ncbi:MAG: hypothetical protein MI976_05130 [Pseudomonadales bacterium]|nr:hypothetical protein [Pseudomonadales bacterium]
MSDYKEVSADDFLTFSREQPSYVAIEQALIELGGGGNKGVEFKKSALNAAGWNYGKLVSYGAHAATAAEAFNKIREALAQSDDGDAVLNKLQQ